jgi:hypothetical protein
MVCPFSRKKRGHPLVIRGTVRNLALTPQNRCYSILESGNSHVILPEMKPQLSDYPRSGTNRIDELEIDLVQVGRRQHPVTPPDLRTSDLA